MIYLKRIARLVWMLIVGSVGTLAALMVLPFLLIAELAVQITHYVRHGSWINEEGWP